MILLKNKHNQCINIFLNRFATAEKAIGAEGFKAVWTEITEGTKLCG